MTKSGWLPRSARFLASHPTRRAGANWAIWAIVLVVVIAVGSANSPSKSKQAAGDGHLPSGLASPSAGNAPPATAVAASSSEPAATAASPTTRTSARPPATISNGDVIRAGVVLPNRRRTPGAINPAVRQANISSTICLPGWTATIRPSSSYTTGLKMQQLATGYAYRGDRNTSDYEEDHLISLELGGSPTSPQNLWPEPYAATDGARIKDRIENKLHALVCAHQISLATAQHAIASNWYAAYQQYEATTVITAPPSTHHRTSPTPPATNGAPPGATALCNDGTYSYAAHHQGACSHHGGVKIFYN